jgi:shikimate dehydrogenase
MSRIGTDGVPVAVPPGIVVGLVGAGIQGSLTPRLHEAEAAAHGLRYIYRLIDLEPLGLGAEALPELLTAAERLGFTGLNITHPCKQSVMPLLHDLSDDARAVGAVNTVLLKDGRRMGHNTDWWGYAESFRRGLAGAKRDRVVQLGAGGAGAAVAHAALTLEVGELTIFDTDRDRAERLTAALVARFGRGRAMLGTDMSRAMAAADGLINTTPVGMAKYPGQPLPAVLLRRELWVSEIIYFPLETELLRAARARGCRTLDGGGMAVLQAAEAFRLFAGITPDAERMRRHFDSMVRG